METPEPTCLILIRCPEPECVGRAPQSAMINKVQLKEMLDADDVTVFGAICGHTWRLSKQEKDNTRRALEKGVL